MGKKEIYIKIKIKDDKFAISAEEIEVNTPEKAIQSIAEKYGITFKALRSLLSDTR